MRIQNLIVPQKGIGRPDYSKEIAMGQIRAGISLKYNQRLVLFLYMPTSLWVPGSASWINIPLAIGPPPLGVPAHLIDPSTGTATPYTIPQGFTLTLVEATCAFTQDMETWYTFDGSLIGNLLGPVAGGIDVTRQPILGSSSTFFDLTGAAAHLIDVMMYNDGVAAMEGGIELVCILEAVGTPPFPTHKDVRCPTCSNIQKELVTATIIKCKSCGANFLVMDTASIRRLP